MQSASSGSGLEKLQAFELVLCERFNCVARRDAVRVPFIVASRLGNGIFWYALMLLLPALYGSRALGASANMFTTGLVCLVIYKLLKGRTARPRPCAVHASIQAGADPLDQYSFPSGHTLHAVAFSITVVAYYPELALLVYPVTVLIALSRVVLGLHYPSDVLAGALLGAILGYALLYS